MPGTKSRADSRSPGRNVLPGVGYDEGMQHDDGQFNGHDGTRLFWQSWLPDDPPEAVLLLVHGHGEHSGRYPYMVQRMVAAGIAVYAYDQRGHGVSPGQRGHIDSIEDYRGDLAAFETLVDSKAAGLPRFLFGHSMGSIVVLDYVMNGLGNFSGLNTSGLGTEPIGVASGLKIFISRILSKFWPTFPTTVDVEAEDLTRVPVELAEYKQDTLVHHKISVRWGAEMLEAIDWIKANPARMPLPIYLQHGDADPLNAHSGSVDFHANVTHPDKELKLYPDNLHDIHRDLDKDKVLTDRIDWIRARI